MNTPSLDFLNNCQFRKFQSCKARSANEDAFWLTFLLPIIYLTSWTSAIANKKLHSLSFDLYEILTKFLLERCLSFDVRAPNTFAFHLVVGLSELPSTDVSSSPITFLECLIPMIRAGELLSQRNGIHSRTWEIYCKGTNMFFLNQLF